MDISEHFLFFIWQYRLLADNHLVCVSGENLQIIYPGRLNKHAGPDFTEARLLIDQTRWAGDVEMHVKSSDWLLHKHEQNKAYDTVILHVVYECDIIITNSAGSPIPTLVIKGLFDERLLNNYLQLLLSAKQFPCRPQIAAIDGLTVKSFLSRLVIERMERKTKEVLDKLTVSKGDWNETFYCFLARNFGFNVNAQAFELLAESLPYQILEKHSDNQLQIEALVFGQAGFLEAGHQQDYPDRLRTEYEFLKHKYRLNALDVSVWKFLRMRPTNFPTMRLAQFSALQFSSEHLFSTILEARELDQLRKVFQSIPVNDYWSRHYHFKKETTEMSVQLGKSSIENILINTVCIFLFAYGKFTDNYALLERSLLFLEQIPTERNSVVDQYVKAGMIIDSAFMSQAVLQLNKFYCTQKKCLNCGIGIKILKR